MELKNCKLCKKLFLSNNINVCNDCLSKENENFEIIKDFLRNNQSIKDVDINMLSEKTGIPSSKILKYINYGGFV